ncbi:hypothetical protein Q766_01905 [Flavobacterium subsaxonicum WB 4.1-42 = DSM 21790]|uniref:Acyltransferase 3 domain-containing protein n=2 Tax=Flavobacterium TaxID=237 RepID=A0A0A2MRB8_9FLAO|nr:hypothetical protein Q766_01905 [Flavobacterium subsaxonicum WB 4.1-42 = DSM 21790]
MTCKSVVTDNFIALFRFGVPCFILLWAFYFEKSMSKKNGREQFQYIKKRLIHLLIVFVIWTALYFLLSIDWPKITLSNITTTKFTDYGWPGRYFLTILFQLLPLYPVIRWLYGKKVLKYIMWLGLFIIYIAYAYMVYHNNMPGILQKIGYKLFVFWLPYVFVGIELARRQTVKLSVYFWVILLIIPVEYNFIVSSNNSTSYILPGILIASIIFCVSLLQNQIIVNKTWLYNTISYIGKNTMTIFVTNPLVIIILKVLLPKKLLFCETIAGKIIMPFISSIVIVCICLLFVELFKKLRINGIVN